MTQDSLCLSNRELIGRQTLDRPLVFQVYFHGYHVVQEVSLRQREDTSGPDTWLLDNLMNREVELCFPTGYNWTVSAPRVT